MFRMIGFTPSKYLLCMLLCLGAYHAHAYAPVMVGQPAPRDVTTITDPETETMYFGELKGFPHMFVIQSDEPFTLKAKMLLPDVEDTPRTINGIIVRNTGFQGRITDVTRLHAKDASWESQYDPWGGDWYLHGVVYESRVDSGTYRIEVSAPDNVGKYVLVVGAEKSSWLTTYFKTLAEIGAVKSFFGKSSIRVLEAPPVFVPLLIVGAFAFWRIRVRKRAQLRS